MYQLHSSALCDWETTEGDDQAAYVYLETEHDLRPLWLNGYTE